MNSLFKKLVACFAAVTLALSMTLTAAAEMTLNAAADMIMTDEADDSDVEPRSSSNIRMLKQQYPSGSRFTGSFDGATQCMGFAYYCYYMYNDEHVNETIPDYDREYYSLESDDNLERFLRKAGTQCYVRGLTKNGSVHSIFIVNYSTSGDTVTVYDCNMDGNCGVLFDTYTYNINNTTYKDFRIHMNKVLFCYTSDGEFYDYTNL